MFDMLPNKMKKVQLEMAALMWPEFGREFELNIFYKKYESCGGEIGKAHIFLWSAQDIEDFEAIRTEVYPASWKIFGGNGSGTYFGFSYDEGRLVFFACDPIDPKGSVTWLGQWPDFIRRVSSADYI